MSLKSVYEQYKHMDVIIETPDYHPIDFRIVMMRDFWHAIRDEAQRPAIDTDALNADLAAARADAEAYRQMVDAIRVRNKELGAECETLRDALQAIQQAFAKGDAKFTKKRWSDSDPYHPAVVKMCAALAIKDEDGAA